MEFREVSRSARQVTHARRSGRKSVVISGTPLGILSTSWARLTLRSVCKLRQPLEKRRCPTNRARCTQGDPWPSKNCAAVRMALGSREGQICGSNLYERLLAFPVWPCDVSVCKWETCTAVGQMESSVRAGRLGASIPMRMREHQNLVQALLGACFRLCGCSSLRCFVVLWALAWF